MPAMDVLAEAWRIAGWAPDDARELVTTVATADAAPEATLDEERLVLAQECLAKAFAVTASWSLAYDAYTAAADTAAPVDAAAAATFRGIAHYLPLAAFASDRDAVAAELDLVRRCVAGETPVVRRALVDIRRALAPRAITGAIEAAFGLAPEDAALFFAAVASVVEPATCAPRSAAAWSELLAPCSRGLRGNARRLVALGLCTETPALVPSSAAVGRLLGRVELAQPPGIALASVAEIGEPMLADVAAPARELAIRGGLAVIVGPPGSGRHRIAAQIARRCGRGLFRAQPAAGAADCIAAAVEAALFGGFVAFDLDEWAAHGVAPVLGAHPAFVIAAADPPIIPARRAFTLRT